MCLYLYAYRFIYLYIFRFIDLYIYMFIYLYFYIYIFMYLCRYIYVCIRVSRDTYTHIYIICHTHILNRNDFFFITYVNILYTYIYI